MKCSPYVSLLAAIVAIALATGGQTPALQKGVSVQMAVTNNAQAEPAADELDAWVIAVTADGRLFFGADQETAESGIRISISKLTREHLSPKSRKLFMLPGKVVLKIQCC